MKFSYRFPVVRGTQAGREYYIGMVPLNMLERIFPADDEYVLPEYRAQRKLNEARIPCFLQALFGEKCKIFLENVASPNWRKLQGLGWQLFCQLHSHCRPYLVVIA